ncbi:MAG TPA: hypothetical protein VMW11_10600 [Candidatus Dormibacteraeota bacterium]|nr:hypothetical protein [Candidatus Dormibacteraeota bacterium]
MIECEHFEDPIALAKDHDRSVCEANFKLSIAPEDESSRRYVVGAERLQPVSPSGHFAEQSLLGATTDPGGE